MNLAIRQPEVCAFCTYRNLGWRTFSNSAPARRHSKTSTPTAGYGKLSESEYLEENGKSNRSWRVSNSQSYQGTARNGDNYITTDSKDGHTGGPNRDRRRGKPQAEISKAALNSVYFSQRSKTPDWLLHRHIIVEYWKTVDRLALSMDGTSEVEGWNLNSPEELYREATKFEKLLKKTIDAVDPDSKRLWRYLRESYNESGFKGLGHELKYRFSSFVMGATFTAADINNQRKLADLRFPMEWFPATRAMQRKIHLHVGPTNSGKTYQALKKLESANSGVYAGPLRLLAHEVYSRLNAKGKACSLITGEERRYPDDYDKLGEAQMISCTVEMMPTSLEVDVAVIDEIQLLGDEERGWAWTQAFLGVKAKEVHLCGELRTVPLIKDLCHAMGDELVVHEYQRLSPLRAMDESLGSLKELEKGDCVIVFSRVGIHAMKKEIESLTGKRCAVVYGSLPPETRAQQAALFNDPDNDYDFLCASDAVGMGLNLSIKRVIFEATSKHDGIAHRTISIPHIKQIGGRAGRFRTAADATKLPEIGDSGSLLDVSQNAGSVGLVTTLDYFDLPIVQRAMVTDPQPILSAGIFPPNNIVTRFASYFPSDTPFSYVLLRLQEISTTHPRFHLCRYKDQLAIADCLQPYNLQITDKLIFIGAPINFREPGMMVVCQAFAKCLAEQEGGDLLGIPEIKLELLDQDGTGKEYLKNLEALHKQITLYLWLSYRFAGVFRSQALAFHIKELLEKKIDESLDAVNFSEARKEHYSELRRKVAEQAKLELESGEGLAKDTPVALPVDWQAAGAAKAGIKYPESAEARETAKGRT